MVEFAFLMPVIVALFMILVQVEMAISTAIVNQKYARGNMYFFFWNHRYYPQWMQGSQPWLDMANGRLRQRFWIGVSDNSTMLTQNDVIPVAPQRRIGAQKADDSPGEEIDSRQNVRIRVAAFTCVPPYGAQVGKLFSMGNLTEDTFGAGNYSYCQN